MRGDSVYPSYFCKVVFKQLWQPLSLELPAALWPYARRRPLLTAQRRPLPAPLWS